jgi:hypothetical protein
MNCLPMLLPRFCVSDQENVGRGVGRAAGHRVVVGSGSWSGDLLLVFDAALRRDYVAKARTNPIPAFSTRPFRSKEGS